MDTAHDVEKDLIGTKTKGSIEIKSYATHFIDRIIGQYSESDYEQKGKRKGVPFADIKNALVNPKKIMSPKVNSKGESSIVYVGESCNVALNLKTGNLIQTNPVRK